MPYKSVEHYLSPLFSDIYEAITICDKTGKIKFSNTPWHLLSPNVKQLAQAHLEQGNVGQFVCTESNATIGIYALFDLLVVVARREEQQLIIKDTY